MYRPSANSFFSGAGLMDVGLIQAGVDVKQSLDLDKNAVQSMKRNPHYFPHKILLQDVKDTLVLEQERTDMIVGTYPYNKYCELADLFGARTGDDLFLHLFRHIVIGKYEMFVVENVPGMKKFQVVMEAMTKIPNYYITVFCPLDASNWLPQRRDRLILIGTRKPFNVSHPERSTSVPKIRDLIEKDAIVEVNDTVISRIRGEYRDKPIIVDPDDENAIAPCCVAHYAKDMGTRLVKDKNYKHGLRPFTIREYARLMGVPDDYKFTNQRISYRLIGNGVVVPMARWIGEQAIRYFN